jgi:hypothetical protein
LSTTCRWPSGPPPLSVPPTFPRPRGRPKLLMTVEAIVSLGIVALVIARAINILK